MTHALLAALMAAAVPAAAAETCAKDPELEKTYVLWITPETDTDRAPCTARLRYEGCEPYLTNDAVTTLGETRTYASESHRVNLTFMLDGAVAAGLYIRPPHAQGAQFVSLGSPTRRRVVVQGIGVDDATAYDPARRSGRKIGNVFFIPAANLTPAAEALCPADK